MKKWYTPWELDIVKGVLIVGAYRTCEKVLSGGYTQKHA